MSRLYDKKAYRDARTRLRGLPCHWCGQPSDTVDHLKPVRMGGTNERANMVAACTSCNSKRGAHLGAAIRRATRREQSIRRW